MEDCSKYVSLKRSSLTATAEYARSKLGPTYSTAMVTNLVLKERVVWINYGYLVEDAETGSLKTVAKILQTGVEHRLVPPFFLRVSNIPRIVARELLKADLSLDKDNRMDGEHLVFNEIGNIIGRESTVIRSHCYSNSARSKIWEAFETLASADDPSHVKARILLRLLIGSGLRLARLPPHLYLKGP